MVDISRQTTGVVLPQTISAEIWAGVQEESSVAALSEPIDLPGPGLTIDVITGDPVPTWQAETAKAGVSRGTVTTKLMTPYTLSVIVPFSNKFRRDKNALFNAMVRRLPRAMAKKIDSTVWFGAAPGSNFDTLVGVGAVALDGTGQTAYDNLVDAEGAIADAGYDLSGFALSPKGISLLRKVKDANGLPLLGTVNGGITDLLGYPTRKTRGVYKNPTDPAKDVIGFAGDWSLARYGVVEDITVSLSDQAAIDDGGTIIYLWQQGMFAIKVEMEVGFVMRDAAGFRQLTGVATTP